MSAFFTPACFLSGASRHARAAPHAASRFTPPARLRLPFGPPAGRDPPTADPYAREAAGFARALERNSAYAVREVWADDAAPAATSSADKRIVRSHHATIVDWMADEARAFGWGNSVLHRAVRLLARLFTLDMEEDAALGELSVRLPTVQRIAHTCLLVSARLEGRDLIDWMADPLATLSELSSGAWSRDAFARDAWEVPRALSFRLNPPTVAAALSPHVDAMWRAHPAAGQAARAVELLAHFLGDATLHASDLLAQLPSLVGEACFEIAWDSSPIRAPRPRPPMAPPSPRAPPPAPFEHFVHDADARRACAARILAVATALLAVPAVPGEWGTAVCDAYRSLRPDVTRIPLRARGARVCASVQHTGQKRARAEPEWSVAVHGARRGAP
jgi:hypothetical protein